VLDAIGADHELTSDRDDPAFPTRERLRAERGALRCVEKVIEKPTGDHSAGRAAQLAVICRGVRCHLVRLRSAKTGHGIGARRSVAFEDVIEKATGYAEPASIASVVCRLLVSRASRGARLA
jgi:hypothetical protein